MTNEERIAVEGKLLDMLAGRYGSGAKGFNVKHVGEDVLPYYCPARAGGNKLLDEDRSVINEMLEKLAGEGYIELVQLRGEKSFTLYGGKFTPKMEEMCAERGVVTTQSKCRDIALMLSDMVSTVISNELLVDWANNCIAVCNDGIVPTVPMGFWSYSDDAWAFADIIAAADAILHNEETVFVKTFATSVFRDSKAFDDSRMRSRVSSLVLMCSDEAVQSEYTQVKTELGGLAAERSLWAAYGIEHVPHYIYTQMDMYFSTSIGDIMTRGLPYAFSSAYVKSEYNKILLNVDTVVCIENLTAYEDFKCDSHTGKFYTGGFLGVADRVLLRRIYKDNRNVRFYHWSDIDAGGFRIFHDVQKYVPTVQPFRMSVEFMKMYMDKAKDLTDLDIARLKAYDGDVFADLVAFMLSTGKKLEQESFF